MVRKGSGKVNLLVTFFSVSSALIADKLLKNAESSCKIIPVPRSVSSSCGYAMKAQNLQPQVLADIMDEKGIEWEQIYLWEKQGDKDDFSVLLSASYGG